MSASGKLEILKAHYGAAGVLDVTDKCKKICTENSGHFIIDGKTDLNSLFGDPEPGKKKTLTILYRYGEGYQQQQQHGEQHGMINIPGISLSNGGVLTLTVHKANNMRDARTFGTQCPYAELTCGGEKFTTKVHDKGGKNAVWNQIFTFNLDGKDQYLHVFIKDEVIGTDSVIGRLDIHLPVLAAAKGENAYPIIHPDDFKRQCGEIILTSSFVDKSAPTKTAEVTVTTTVVATAPAPSVQPTPQPMAVSPQPQVIYQQPQAQPQVVYQQPQAQPQVVYQPPVVQQQPQVVYQQPQVVYQPPVVVQQPQVVYAQPQPAVVQAPTMVYAQPSAPAPVASSPAKPVPKEPGTRVCHAAKKQSGWRWCCKCMNMCYSGLTGVCAQGGNHDHTGSGAYHMPLASAHGCGAQDNWKWCNKCQSIAYAGGTPSVCAAGGSHNHGGSGAYYMCLAGKHGQVGWAWCKNCSVLFYGAMAQKSNCPATGGGHDQSASGSYQVGHD